MEPQTLVFGSMLALGAVQVLVLAFLYRLRAGDVGRGRIEGPPGDEVRCPCCGEPNEVGYRFCRPCVDELPCAKPSSRVPRALRGRPLL